jgi:hypothetical protein
MPTPLAHSVRPLAEIKRSSTCMSSTREDELSKRRAAAEGLDELCWAKYIAMRVVPSIAVVKSIVCNTISAYRTLRHPNQVTGVVKSERGVASPFFPMNLPAALQSFPSGFSNRVGFKNRVLM